MNAHLFFGGKAHAARLADPAPLLCLPKVKTPRLVGDWAEEDGLDYDLSEPLWLERLPLTLTVNSPYRPTPGDRPELSAFGRRLPLDVLYATEHRPHDGWTELRVALSDLSPLFGTGQVSDETFRPEELQRQGIRFHLDADALRRAPEQKVAFELSSKADHGALSALAPGRKERSLTMLSWIDGPDCIERHLAFCAALRSRVAGHWVIGGKDFFLRYQAMEIEKYLPAQLVAARITLQQYRYS